MKLGIYGGTFNPVHLGHIHLLKEVKRQTGLDKILVMPDRVPPHKMADDLASAEDRAKMLRLATAGMEGVEVSEMELEKEGRSYTYLTLRELKKRFPGDTLYLIMGADMLLSFDRWRNWEEILENAHLIAAARDDGEYEALLRKARVLGNTDVLKITPLPMSSTDVRRAVSEKKPLSGMVPEAVENYILAAGLYGAGSGRKD